MSNATNCVNCGANVDRRSTDSCGFCGTMFARPVSAHGATPAPPPAAPSTPFGDIETRLEAARTHPDWSELQTRVPSEDYVRHTLRKRSQFGVVLTIIGAILTVVMLASLVGILVAVVGVILVVKGVRLMRDSSERLRLFDAAQVERVPAVVVDERVEVSGGGRRRRAWTRYFVSAEFENGTRTELRAGPDVAGRVTQGDAGVAYVRQGYLLDFARLRV